MEYQIEITDTIGWWECSYNYLKQKFNEYKGKHVDVKISSLGGDANEGLKIYQLLRDHGDVTAYLSGFVASAATVIALGANKTVIGKNSLYLIHNCLCWVDNWGTMNKEEIQESIKELQKTIARQEKIDHMVASMYADKCGKKVEDLKTIMTKNEWMTPQEALDLGLVDEIRDEKPNAMNAKMNARLQASSLPKIPVGFAHKEEDKPSLATQVANELAKIFNPNPKLKIAEENNPPAQNNITMNKNFVAVMALLAIEAMTEKDGNISVTTAQMQTINDKLAELEKNATTQADTLKSETEAKLAAEKKTADLETKVKDLEDKIKALESQAPDPKSVVQQGKDPDDNEPVSEEEAYKIAMAFMGK